MYTHTPRRGPHPRTAARQAAARLRRLAAALAAPTCAVLAAAAVPAASAHTLVRDPPGGAPLAPVPAPAAQVVTVGCTGPDSHYFSLDPVRITLTKVNQVTTGSLVEAP